MQDRKPSSVALTDVVGTNTDGTQAIRRAASILRRIAKADSQGMSLADLSRTEMLPRSTAYRILRCLVEEGIVEHNMASKRYQIGDLVYELGLAASRAAMEVARWRSAVEAVARRTGATAYLMRRSGVEAVCLLKCEGNSVIRVIPVEVGQRRLLGMGGGATALLAALEPAVCDNVIDTLFGDAGDPPRLNKEVVRRNVENARKTGFSISSGSVVENVFGMGRAIPSASATPSLAISIATHDSLVNKSAVASWKAVLTEEIDSALSRQAGAGPRRA